MERSDIGSSAIVFLEAQSRRPVDALANARTTLTSRRLAWPGLIVEAGHKPSWEVDDLTVAHHYLALNVDPHPLRFDVRGGDRGRFRRVTLDPGSIWVCPSEEPFTHRVRDPSSYILVSIEPSYLERLVRHSNDGASRATLRRAYGVGSSQLEHVVKALAAEAEQRNPHGVVFVDALAMALGLHLLQGAGENRLRPERSRDGLSITARRRVLDLIASYSDGELAGLSIEALAREVGLPIRRFARAFRKSMGRPPYRLLLSTRLERARRLLDAQGASLTDVALRLGFADQAHFTRLFKREFSVTPGVVLRERSRGV